MNQLGPRGPRIQAHHWIDKDPQFWFTPTQHQTFRRHSSHYAIESQENSWFAPTQYKTYRRNTSHFAIEPEQHTWLNVTRAAPAVPEYTLAFGDGTANAVYDGRISLLKDGHVVQTISALPDPTNQQFMLLSVSSAGTIHCRPDVGHVQHLCNTPPFLKIFV